MARWLEPSFSLFTALLGPLRLSLLIWRLTHVECQTAWIRRVLSRDSPTPTLSYLS